MKREEGSPERDQTQKLLESDGQRQKEREGGGERDRERVKDVAPKEFKEKG